ncbi:MAG: hypothetical protein LBP57_00095 [Endomicrobium sp.]|jgi:hypothetical protein|nr:hypothetical protein [Endomicrobium sp.]
MRENKLRFNIIMTKEEHEAIRKEARKRKKTMSTFIKDAVFRRMNNKRIVQLEKIVLLNEEIIINTAKMGSNLNQMAAHLNSGFAIREEEFYTLAEEIKKNTRKLVEEMRDINDILKKEFYR